MKSQIPKSFGSALSGGPFNRIAFSLVGLFLLPSYARAQSSIDTVFLTELSKLAIGSEKPVPDSRLKVFKGVALTPVGAPWTLSTDPDEVNPQLTLPGSSRLAMQFNFSLDVRAGIANSQRSENLEQLWETLLSYSVPLDPANSSSADSILYKKRDMVDIARGTPPLLEPTEEYQRYLEYRSAWAILAATDDDDGAWRLHPRFQGFVGLKEARDQISADWSRFGYRAEMESAITKLETSRQAKGWKEWLLAKSAFEDNTLALVPEVKVGTTRFFPGQSTWATMPSWNRVEFNSGTSTPISCEIARVEIQRPWMRLSLLSDKNFKLGPASDLGVLSDGATPTATEFARGRFANLPTELILVRHIKAPPDSKHRLAMFTDREVINLIGYVVTILPRIAAE
jgi:hypothetical protein